MYQYQLFDIHNTNSVAFFTSMGFLVDLEHFKNLFLQQTDKTIIKGQAEYTLALPDCCVFLFKYVRC